MNAPLPISTLADKAVLVRFACGTYQPYAFDKKATDEVEAAYHVQQAGRFNKRLFKDCEALALCNSAYRAVYAKHIELTLPWLDDGMRMLPSYKYEAYRDALRPLMREAELAADRLQRDWDQLVIEDLTRLGPLGNHKDYPINIRDRYYIDLRFLPVPSQGDFRVDISDEDKASIERALKEAEQNATKYLVSEMLKPLKHAVTKLNIPIGAEGSVFRDSLVENLLDTIERAADLNIMGDYEISAAVTNLRVTLAGVAPESLRESDEVRSATANKLDEVMSRLSAYMGAQ